MAAAASPILILAFRNSAPEYWKDWARSVKEIFAEVTAVANWSTTWVAFCEGILKVCMMLVIKSATPPF